MIPNIVFLQKSLDKPDLLWYNIQVSCSRDIVILARSKLQGEIQKEVCIMAKVSAKYEVMVVFSLKNGEEPMKALIQKFKERIERHAEAVEVNEDWGKRKLAYPIEDETEGYYVIYTFQSQPDYPAELSRRLNITDGILRSLVTVVE